MDTNMEICKRMKYLMSDEVRIDLPCGFQSYGHIVGIGGDLILNRQWIVQIYKRYPGIDFDCVLLDESCITSV